MDKLSDNYKRLDITLYPELQEAGDVIKSLAYDGFELVELPNNLKAFICAIEVDAGTKSLIRRVEPIVIVVDEKDVERVCPITYPDRLDFPFDKLPHVNYPVDGMPQSICLSRESPSEWYSEITFKQYVETVIQWLNDAANDRLIKIRNNDQYEPYRVLFTKDVLFWLDVFDDIVQQSTTHINEYFDVNTITNPDKSSSGLISGEKRFNQNALAVQLGRPNNIIEYDWLIYTPKTINELFITIQKMNFMIDRTQLRNIIDEHDNIQYVYIVLSVIRPTQVIGKQNNVDSICFRFQADSLRNNNNDAVESVNLINQTNKIFAAKLSQTSMDIFTKRILIIGSGAVGSKIIDHLYKAGICNLTICDNDTFLPHNVIRHTLNCFSFEKKAKLIKEHLETMFMCRADVDIVTDDAIHHLHSKGTSEYDLIIDCSASNRVMYALDDMNILCPIVRCCLSNQGNVGITYVKRNGNIKLQEYYMEILRIAMSRDYDGNDVSKWIMSDSKTTLDYVRIGEGCHSNTMIISDDTISSHAALSSRIIKNMFSTGENVNSLYLSIANCDYEGSMYTLLQNMPIYISIPSDDSKWIIRIPEDVHQKIRNATKASLKNETGGYLIGYVFEKKRTIWIVDTFIPKDSIRKPNKLILGKSGWKDHLNYCVHRSGGQVVYLGDWHSHPDGSVLWSEQDQETFSKLKSETNKIGVCLITTGCSEMAYII